MIPKKSKQKRITERGCVLINFEIAPDLHDKLRELAILEDRTISAVLRRLIKQHLSQAGI
jgi:predicted transcriptional regulator